MRRLIAITVITGTLALAGAAPGLADETVSFHAQANQTSLVSQSCAAGVCDLVFEGSGAANIVGPFTLTSHIVMDFTVTDCNPFTAEHTLVGATGSITIADAGTVCQNPDSPSGFPFTISGSWEIIGGTGEFRGISGSGTSQGTIAGNGPVVHFSGTVSF
jgi:hypothetical protein